MQIKHLSSERLSNMSNNTQPVKAEGGSDPSLPDSKAGIFPLHQAPSPSCSHPSIHSLHSLLSRSNWKSVLSVGISWVGQTRECSGSTHVRIVSCPSSLCVPKGSTHPYCVVFPCWDLPGASFAFPRQWPHHPFSVSPSRFLLQLPNFVDSQRLGYVECQGWKDTQRAFKMTVRSREQGTCLQLYTDVWQDQD